MINGSMYEYLTTQQPHSSQKIERMVRQLIYLYAGDHHRITDPGNRGRAGILT
jgi:hypothetical protein